MQELTKEVETKEVSPFDTMELTKYIQNTPEVYEDLRMRSEKAVEAGIQLLEKAEEEGMDDKLAEDFVKYIKRARSTVKMASDKRKPYTQMFQAVSKGFTSLENNIKEVSNRIKEVLDDYAAKKEEERRKAEEAARIEAEKKKERETLAADAEKGLKVAFVYLRGKHEQNLHSLLNSMVLNNIDQNKKEISEYSEELPVKELKWPTMQPEYITADELKAIKKEVGARLAKELRENYTQRIADLKKELLDKVPSKVQELEEEKKLHEEAEAARKAAEEAEKKRQEEIAKANAKKKAELEAKAKKEKEAEEKRQAELKAKQDKLEAERKAREEEEAKARAEAEAEEKKKAEQEAKARGDTATMDSLFDVEQAANATDVPKGAVSYTIVVNHQQGYAEMFAMWFAKEGGSMPMDKLEKMTLGRIKSFWEKLATKTGEKLESKFFKYKEGYKTSVRR